MMGLALHCEARPLQFRQVPYRGDRRAHFHRFAPQYPSRTMAWAARLSQWITRGIASGEVARGICTAGLSGVSA